MSERALLWLALLSKQQHIVRQRRVFFFSSLCDLFPFLFSKNNSLAANARASRGTAGWLVYCILRVRANKQMSASGASYADSGSLALFCATALFHRRYILYRERREKAAIKLRRRPDRPANDGAYNQRSIGRARRISFDGHASFSADASNGSASSTANDGDDPTLRSSFRIFGGDEMDDDEVDQTVANYYHSSSSGNNSWGGGVMTSAGATAAKSAQLRLRRSPIQEGEEEEEDEEDEGLADDDGNTDCDDGDFDVGSSGLARVLNTLGRGVSFFVEIGRAHV